MVTIFRMVAEDDRSTIHDEGRTRKMALRPVTRELPRRPMLRGDNAADSAFLHAIAARFAPMELLRWPLWVFCPERLQMVWANRAGRGVWEASSLEDLQRRDLGADLTDAMRHTIYVTMSRLAKGEEKVIEVTSIFPRGIAKRVHMTHTLALLPDGGHAMLSEVEVEPPAEQLVQLASQLSLLLVLFDREGHRLSMNRAFQSLIGDRVRTLSDLVEGRVPTDELVASLSPTEPAASDVELDTTRGPRVFRLELRLVAGLDGSMRVLASLYDVTTHRRERAELLKLAHTDTLSGLANRHGALLEGARREASSAPYDVLYIDLDGLKQLNDSLGHRFGDLAIEAAARRIAALVPSDGFAGRMGGDEFVVVVASGGEDLAERLRAALSMSYELEGVRVVLTASIGVVLAEVGRGMPFEARVRKADQAMFEAKRDGRNRTVLSRVAMIDAETRARRIHDLLPEAASGKGLSIVVQPIVDLETGRIARGEALIRWRHEELGPISPAEFIPLAEQSGIVRELGRFVLSETSRLIAAMHREGRHVPLSVNLSAREVTLPTLAEDVAAELVRFAIPPHMLSVELTESAMIGRFDLAAAQLAKVRALGVGLALDDFGTGYSALSIVHRLEVDTIKLDRSLVSDLPEARAIAVARAVILLAESLGASVVAEGIENLTQADVLRALGCRYGQGYHFARPLAAADFLALVQLGDPLPVQR
jgi:diguanylate cyclase (GGDEF)-like protein